MLRKILSSKCRAIHGHSDGILADIIEFDLLKPVDERGGDFLVCGDLGEMNHDFSEQRDVQLSSSLVACNIVRGWSESFCEVRCEMKSDPAGKMESK